MINRKNILYCVLAIVLFVASIILVFRIPNRTYKDVYYGNYYNGVTDVIDVEKVYKQTFSANNKIKSICIKMATFMSELTGEYILEIGNNESGDVIFSHTIHGEDVVDGEYYPFKFPYELEGKTEYYFTIYAIDKQQDTLLMWVSEGSCGNVKLYKNGELTNQECCFIVSERKVNKRVVASVFLVCLFAVLTMIFVGAKYTKQVIYAFGFLIVISGMFIYYNERGLGIYDEMAHISYLTYVSEGHGIIPRFEEMKLLVPEAIAVTDGVQTVMLEQTEGVFKGRKSNTVCYLGHAPLYYWILNIFKGVTTDSAGIVSVDLDKLRLLNVGMVLLALFIMFYIGYTRIGDKNMNHLLYAIVISTLPMFAFLGVTINNDNLTILSVALTFLGAIRISEKKYDIKTYLLVALGVCMTLMCKLTAGMIIVIAALIIILITIIRDKSFDILLNRYFLCTIPIYLLVIAYYLIIYGRYGAFQPSLTRLISEDEFKNYAMLYHKTADFVESSCSEYLSYFENSFRKQWSDGVYGYTLSGLMVDISKWFYRIFWLIIGCQSIKVLSSKRENYMLGAFSIGITATVISEFFIAYKSYLYSGHGATQSRYYVCVLVVMAMIFVNFIQGLRARVNRSADDSETKIDYVDSLSMVIVYLLIYCNSTMFYTR